MVIYKGRRIPDENTQGNVDDLYINVLTRDIYRLVRVEKPGAELGFITVYARESKPSRYIWQLESGVDNTIVLVDENGVELVAVLTDKEVDLTADEDDIRLGETAVTDEGIVVGEKEIPNYLAEEGSVIIEPGAPLDIPMFSDMCQYSTLQSVICDYNTDLFDSVAAVKVAINGKVYDTGSTDALSDISVDVNSQTIKFGLTNENDKAIVIWYMVIKEDN